MKAILTILLFCLCSSGFSQTANAGKDTSINIKKTNSVTLDGSGSSGSSFLWEEISTDYSSGGIISNTTIKTPTLSNLQKNGTFYFRISATTGGITKSDTMIVRCVSVDPLPSAATLQSTMIFSQMTELNLRDDTVNYYLPWSKDPLAHNIVGVSPNRYYTYRDRQTGAYIDSARGKLYNIVQDGYSATNAKYARAEMQVDDQSWNVYDSNLVYIFEWRGYFRDDPTVADPNKSHTAIFQLHGRNEVSPPFQLLNVHGYLVWYENYAQGHNGENGQEPHTGWVGTDIMPISELYRKSHTVQIIMKQGDGMLNQTSFVELRIDGERKYYRNDGRIGERWVQNQQNGVWQSDYTKFCTLYDYNNSLVDYSNKVRGRKFALATEHYAQYVMTYEDYLEWQKPVITVRQELILRPGMKLKNKN